MTNTFLLTTRNNCNCFKTFLSSDNACRAKASNNITSFAVIIGLGYIQIHKKVTKCARWYSRNDMQTPINTSVTKLIINTYL